MSSDILIEKALAVRSLFDLEGKTAIVTGGARGLGRACALALAGAGANIVIADQNANNTVQEIVQMGRKATSVLVDVRNEEQVASMVKQAVDAFGKVDILVNCAGIAEVKPIVDFELELWERIMDINVKGIFLCSREAARQMLKQGTGGRIISISSLQSFAGRKGDPAYSTSKGAVNLMTKSMACEWAEDGICVNAIAPTWCWTDMTAPTLGKEDFYAELKRRIPAGRACNQDDLFGLVVFLASKASAFVNGAIIPLDGGAIACDGFPAAL